MLRHIWPNLLPLVVANTFLNFAFALVTLAGLSFLGIGVDARHARLGPDARRVAHAALRQPVGRARARRSMLVLTAVSMNLVGDWLYERLSDRGRAR